jgi:hypothetical protein
LTTPCQGSQENEDLQENRDQRDLRESEEREDEESRVNLGNRCLTPWCTFYLHWHLLLH